MRLWVPQDSEFVRDTEWMFEHFGQGLRMEGMILTADNVLEPEVLAKVVIVFPVLSCPMEKYILCNACFNPSS